MNQIEKAIEFALKAHAGQKDRYDKPYILHPLRLMMKMNTENEMISAILHDVVEDSDYTIDDLKKEGFPAEVIETVDCLTKRNDEEYFEYLKRAISTTMSGKVKLADLEDNMNIRRMDEINEKDIERLNRYLKAWRIMKNRNEHDQ